MVGQGAALVLEFFDGGEAGGRFVVDGAEVVKLLGGDVEGHEAGRLIQHSREERESGVDGDEDAVEGALAQGSGDFELAAHAGADAAGEQRQALNPAVVLPEVHDNPDGLDVIQVGEVLAPVEVLGAKAYFRGHQQG